MIFSFGDDVEAFVELYVEALSVVTNDAPRFVGVSQLQSFAA
jgi:hypothetical protein